MWTGLTKRGQTGIIFAKYDKPEHLRKLKQNKDDQYWDKDISLQFIAEYHLN